VSIKEVEIIKINNNKNKFLIEKLDSSIKISNKNIENDEALLKKCEQELKNKQEILDATKENLIQENEK